MPKMALASEGMCCLPVPVLAIWKVWLPVPWGPWKPPVVLRVSTARNGLYAVPVPSSESARTALTFFQPA